MPVIFIIWHQASANQVLIRSLNLGRAWFSLHHLFGWSTAVRDLQCEGSLEGPSGSSQTRKRWFLQGGFPLPVPHECWCPNPSGTLSSVSLAFNGTSSEAEQNPLNPAGSVWECIQSRVCKQCHSLFLETLKCAIFLLQAGAARAVGFGSGGDGGAEGCGVAMAQGWLGGLVVPTRRVLLSPGAVCHSKTNTSVLWVPSQ